MAPTAEQPLILLPTPRYGESGGYWQLTLAARPPYVEDGAGYWPQTWADLNQYTNEGICGAQADGHLEGFMTAPEMLGEISENILYGGGLAPASPRFGTRTVNYVYYILRGTREKVEAAVRHHMKVWASPPLTIDHHGLGFLSDGYLASPPSVEWLTYRHEAGVKVTVTVTFVNPFISTVDARHASLVGRVKYSAIDTSGGSEFDLPTFTAWEPSEGTGIVTLGNGLNLSGVPAYPLIAVKRPPGQDADKVLAFTVQTWDQSTGESAIYTANTGSTYATGIAILDTANPNVFYRSNDTSYPASWVGAVPTPSDLASPSGSAMNYRIGVATEKVPNAITAIDAALLCADAQI